MFKFKQAIVVRNDLKMSTGKIAVQVAHASLSSAEECRKINIEWYNKWIDEGQKKVVLKVPNLQELLKLYDKAKMMKLPVAIIEDAGLTELEPGTVTALGIGPAPSEEIDKVTGNLPLL
ncbi:MAG: peptidyl-tRNA hydrolase Pth2 [Thaumarchaeota archaeon]|jgi:peptidyl-tRNA hydrolase, PTH2 family|nr:peptidyl-tRNA hydrolase Pth2 [Candidatus Geocrenenecus arthurdayi]MCL7401300.1 peptidyl-tRNA hydrolase Pth2 [Candidatus Geocrenenecus arthurdayi]MCL7404232.1 peptidyl-tRNA hydrolase Pth2 [Candidatus Geocrenenecus arthurdayi]